LTLPERSRTLPVMALRSFIGTGEAGVFSSLQHPQYRALWTATSLSAVANWTLLTGRGWVAYDMHHHSSTVGLVVFAAMLPYLFVTPFGGVLADRVDRRLVLTGTLLVSLLSAVALALIVILGVRTEWPLVLLSFINGSARAVEVPAGQSMVPAMVPERELLNAVALSSLSMHGSRLVGPLVAAPLLDVGGASGAFVLSALIYAVAVAQVLRLRSVPQAHSRTEGVGEQLAEGVRYTLQNRVVLLITIITFFHCGLTMAYDAVLPVMAKDVLGAGGSSYSYLVMSIGAGSLVGTLALAGLPGNLHRGLLLFTVGILSGGTLILFAFAGDWSTAIAAAALVGGAQAMFMALTNTFLQLATPDVVRGRVLSIYMMLSGGVMAFGNLASGRLADAFGVTPVLALPSLAFMVVIALSVLGPSLRGVYARRAAPAAVR
jgi:MFS family permease